MLRVNQSAIGTISLFGTNYTKCARDVHWDYEDNTEDGRGIGEVHGDTVTTKSKFTFGGSFLRTVGGVRQSMLSLSLFTLGGTTFLGRVKSGSINTEAVVSEDSGGADQWEYPNVQAVNFDGSAVILLANAASFAAIMAGVPSSRAMLLKATMGGFACELPITITKSAHTGSNSESQREAITFSNKGSAGIVATGDPILVSMLTGAAMGAFSFDTGVGTYSATDGAVCLSAGFNFSDGQIIEDAFEFQARGPVPAPTLP